MTLSQFCQSFPHTWFAAYYQYVYFHSFMHVCIFHLPYFLPLIGLSIPFLFTFIAFPPSVCLFLRVPRVHQAAPGRLTTASWPQLEHENTPSLLPLPPPRLPPHWYHSNHTDTSNTTLIPSRWYHQHYSSHCLFLRVCWYVMCKHTDTNAPLPPRCYQCTTTARCYQHISTTTLIPSSFYPHIATASTATSISITHYYFVWY